MKLIECYVENFGKISDRKFIFTDGLNCIKEDNGVGKTTLSVFIKCMLYGMSDTKKPSLEENDRKHYLPWGGGVCGGTLTFSVRKKRYRIERTFGQKASDDTYKLIDLDFGRATSDFAEPLGESLFGIDRDGFERTVFLSERYLSPKNDNKSISAKLSDLVGSDGDIGAMDNAIKILENQRKFYQKRSGGEIDAVKNEIYRTEDELARLSRLESQLIGEEMRAKENRERLAELKEKESALISRREMAVRREAKKENEVRLEGLVKSLESDTKARDGLIEFFGGTVPSFSEIDEASYRATEAKRIRESASVGAGGEYSELDALFATRVSSYDIENADRALRDTMAKKARVSPIDKKKYERIFKKRVPEISEIDNEIKREKKTRNAKIVNNSFLFAAVLLALIGGLLGSLVSGYYFVMTVIGGILLVLFGILKLRGAKNILSSDEFFSSLSDGEIPKDNLGALIEMRELLIRIGSLMKPDDGDMRALYDLCERVPLAGGEDVFECVKEIIAKYRRYELLTLSEEYRRSEHNARLSAAEKIEEEAEKFLTRFKITTDSPYTELRDKLLEYNRLSSRIIESRREITEFQSSLRLGEADASEKTGLDELDGERRILEEKISTLMRENALAERQCRVIAEQLEARDELTARLDNLKEKLAKYEENYATVVLTKEYLTRAKDAVTVKYLGKTKESFEKYTARIGALSGEYDMDTSFAVSKIEGSSARPVEAYSKGTRDLFNIAARFAMIDSLYENESPFVILDDPFVSFDDEKTKRALALILELAKTRQIIYFTCSASRAT